MINFTQKKARPEKKSFYLLIIHVLITTITQPKNNAKGHKHLYTFTILPNISQITRCCTLNLLFKTQMLKILTVQNATKPKKTMLDFTTKSYFLYYPKQIPKHKKT